MRPSSRRSTPPTRTAIRRGSVRDGVSSQAASVGWNHETHVEGRYGDGFMQERPPAEGMFMTVDTRRASALALVILAIVAVSLVRCTRTGRTPQALPRETVTAGSTPAPDASASASTAAAVPLTADTLASAPLSAHPSSYDRDLDRDLDLSGMVVDPDGAPVAGATVQAVFHPARTRAPREASPLAVLGPVTRSGIDGTFAVRLLRGQRAGLRVTAAGFVPCERSPATAGERLRVVVRPAVSCVVTLRDANRRPVAGRPVLLEHSAFRPEVLLHREALSDAEGRARFEDLPAGLTITTRADSDPRSLGAVLPLRGTLEIEVSVSPGRALRGRVTDGETGLPIPGAQVRLTIPRAGTAATTADADGRYSFQGVPEPAQGRRDDDPPRPAATVRVTADGYVAATATDPAGTVHDVALESAETVTGRAVDGDGTPIATAWVFLEAEFQARGRPVGMPMDWEFTPAAMTDADGRFRIATRTSYGGLRVEAVGFAPLAHSMARRELPPGPIDVGDLVLGPGLMLEGHVSDGEGRRMPGVSVYVGDVTFTSGDLGRYRVRDLTPGRHRIRAVAKGRDQLQRDVTLSPDRDPTVLDLAFPAGREVTIEVRDASGVPVAGAGLHVVHRRIWEHTDAQGRGVVIVPPGPWKTRVTAGSHRHTDGRPVFVSREAVISADATHLVVTLDRTPPPEDMRDIAGTVVDDEGRPVDGVRLSVTWEGRGDPSQHAERVRSGEDGSFAVRVPKDAVCDIRADARVRKDARPSKMTPHDPWEGESKGVPAGRTDVVVVARPERRDRTVTVLVLSPDGDPLEDIPVQLSGTLRERVRARTRKDGRAEFARLVHRSYSAWVDPPESRRSEWLPMQSPSFLPAGQEIAVRLRRAAEITGTVVLSDGSPAPRAHVTFMADTNSTRQTVSADASGRFLLRVDAALPLPWRLTATLGQDWPRIEVSVDLAAPPSADVTLCFPDPMRR